MTSESLHLLGLVEVIHASMLHTCAACSMTQQRQKYIDLDRVLLVHDCQGIWTIYFLPMFYTAGKIPHLQRTGRSVILIKDNCKCERQNLKMLYDFYVIYTLLQTIGI